MVQELEKQELKNELIIIPAEEQKVKAKIKEEKMKRKFVSIFVFLTLVMTAFAIVPTNVNAEDDPDFSLTVFPSSQTVAPGEYTTFLVTVTSLNGFDSPVTLSISGLPEGAYAYFNPNPVTPTDNSILTISTTEEVEKTIKLPNFDYKIFKDITGITKKMIKAKLRK